MNIIKIILNIIFKNKKEIKQTKNKYNIKTFKNKNIKLKQKIKIKIKKQINLSPNLRTLYPIHPLPLTTYLTFPSPYVTLPPPTSTTRSPYVTPPHHPLTTHNSHPPKLPCICIYPYPPSHAIKLIYTPC